MRTTVTATVLFLLSIAGCSTAVNTQPEPASVPAYLVSEKGCALILGGAVGDHFGQREIDEFWAAANTKIAATLQKNLQKSGYQAIGLSIDIRDRDSISDILGRAIASNKCNLTIQLSHTIDQDAQGNFFQYELVVLRAKPQQQSTKGTRAVTEKLYSKTYRYRRTSAVLQSFQIDDFARLLENDMQTAGILDRVQRGA